MKKQLLLSWVLVIVSMASVLGQVTIIPKAGVTFTNWMTSDDAASWQFGVYPPESKFGFMLGAAFEIPMTDKFAVQPELLFIQKGYRRDGEGDGMEYTTRTTANYLELPVLAKVKFGKFYLNAGPSIGLGIGGKHKSEVTSGGDPQEETYKVKFGDDHGDDVVVIQNAWDFGVQLGGGAKLGPVVLDIRYGLGLSNLYDKPEDFDGDWSIRNSAFQLTVGYPIPLGY